MTEPLEVPQRDVEHGFFFDDYAYGELVASTGTATTLNVSNQAKAAVRRKREKLDRDLGGFGFRSAA